MPLGHASITTTARYVDHIAPRAVIEAMRRRSWTGAKTYAAHMLFGTFLIFEQLRP